MNNWNVMIRQAHEAHFIPTWDQGMPEADARRHYNWLVADTYWSARSESQLVTDFSCHIVEEPVLASDGTTYMEENVIVDGWKKVDA